jgi:hypothetical protein
MSLTAQCRPGSQTHYVRLNNDNQDKPRNEKLGNANNNASGQPVEQGTGQTSKRTIYNTLTTSFRDFGRSIGKKWTDAEDCLGKLFGEDRSARRNHAQSKSVPRHSVSELDPALTCFNLEDIKKDAALVEKARKDPNSIKDWKAACTALYNHLIAKYADVEGANRKETGIKTANKLCATLGIKPDDYLVSPLELVTVDNAKEFFQKLDSSDLVHEEYNGCIDQTLTGMGKPYSRLCFMITYMNSINDSRTGENGLIESLKYYIQEQIQDENGQFSQAEVDTIVKEVLSNLDICCPKLKLHGSTRLFNFDLKKLRPEANKVIAKQIFHKMVNADILKRGVENNNAPQIIRAHRWANITFSKLGINPPLVEYKLGEYGNYNNEELIKYSNEITTEKLEKLRDDYNKFKQFPKYYSFESCI